MKYFITIRNGNGETIATETTAAAFVWANGKPQNNVYATAAALVADTPTAAAFRALPCDDTMLALHVATAAARAAANRGGRAAACEHTDTDTPTEKAAREKAARRAARQTAAARANVTQETIYGDLRRIAAGTAAACATANGGTAETAAAYIMEKLPETSAHTQDFFSVCLLAILDTNGTPTEKAAAAFRAVNALTRQEKTRNERETSTEFIMDGGGDLVAFGTAAACILKGGDKWTPTAAANMDTETAAALGRALAAAFALLSPVQRDVVRRVVRGYSVRQTAAALGRSVSTVQRNVENVRRVFAAYIHDNAPQFDSIITAATAAATAAGTAAAARQKAYRERKKAAAATAAANV